MIRNDFGPQYFSTSLVGGLLLGKIVIMFNHLIGFQK